MKEVIIIGGGIIGLATAYYLSENGHQVTVFDRGNFTSGCSFENAGLIVPSHVIPLAAPGVLSQGLKWMLTSGSPLSVSPSLNPSFIKWCLRFAKSANNRNLPDSATALRDISLLSSSLYEKLAKEKTLDLKLQQKGLMMLYKTKKTEKEEQRIASLANRIGIQASILSGNEVQELQQDLSVNALGAVYYPGDSHILPTNLMASLVNILKKRGVKLIGNVGVNKLIKKSNSIEGVMTTAGSFFADEVIVSAGVWSNKITRELGLNILLQAGKGYSFTDSPQKSLAIPSILIESRVAITPYKDFTRFAGVMELGNQKNKVRLSKIKSMHKAINSVFPEMKLDFPEVKNIWHGLRPCSSDGLPYIGRTKKYNNLIIATGHSMLGVSLAPATGKLVTEIVDNKKTTINIKPFFPERN